MNDEEFMLRLLEGKPVCPFLVAIDGRCTAGKTTLAGLLQGTRSCNVVHMDDFYLPFAKRTPERMAQPGGNMDFERLLSEVLLPLKSGAEALYRPYNCHADYFLPTQPLSAAIPTVIEGSYSCHPLLREYYNLRVFLDISPELQAKRLMARNPAAFEAFQTMWIPREEAYFSACRVREHCDIVLNGSAAE